MKVDNWHIKTDNDYRGFKHIKHLKIQEFLDFNFSLSFIGCVEVAGPSTHHSKPGSENYGLWPMAPIQFTPYYKAVSQEKFHNESVTMVIHCELLIKL